MSTEDILHLLARVAKEYGIIDNFPNIHTMNFVEQMNYVDKFSGESAETFEDENFTTTYKAHANMV
jgi:hypothetical protein